MEIVFSIVVSGIFATLAIISSLSSQSRVNFLQTMINKTEASYAVELAALHGALLARAGLPTDGTSIGDGMFSIPLPPGMVRRGGGNNFAYVPGAVGANGNSTCGAFRFNDNSQWFQSCLIAPRPKIRYVPLSACVPYNGTPQFQVSFANTLACTDSFAATSNLYTFDPHSNLYPHMNYGRIRPSTPIPPITTDFTYVVNCQGPGGPSVITPDSNATVSVEPWAAINSVSKNPVDFGESVTMTYETKPNGQPACILQYSVDGGPFVDWQNNLSAGTGTSNTTLPLTKNTTFRIRCPATKPGCREFYFFLPHRSFS